MAHGFAGFKDGRHNKGYTAAFNKMLWNRGVPLARDLGKALYQKIKSRLGKKPNPEDESVALVAQHSTSEVVPVTVKSVGNTNNIFGGRGISRNLGGGFGGIDPDVMGGSLANFASPRRMNKGYDIIDITPVNSSKESDSNFMPLPGGGAGGSLANVETAIYDLTREVNETKMAMINIATKQMQQADIYAANQRAMQERALMAQQHTLSPSLGTTGPNSSSLMKPKKGSGRLGIPIPTGRGLKRGGTGSIMRRGSKRGLTRAAAKVGGKGLAKKAAKFGAKTAGKQIPGLGLIMGGGLGLMRLMKGDVLGALSEVTQGALTTFAPGVGNALALGLDLMTPAMADGGIVQSPTTALIGEEGPELVQPLNKEAYEVMGDGLLDSWNKRSTEIHRFISGGMKLYQKEEGRYLGGNGSPGISEPGGKGWYGHDVPLNAPRGPARVMSGLLDALLFDFVDTDQRGSIWENEHGQSRGPGRWIQGMADWATGDRFDFDRRDENAPASAVKAENDMLGRKPPNRSSIMKYVKNKGVSDKRAKLIAQSGDSAPSSTGGMFDLNTTDFAAMKSAVPDWATNWQAQVDWVMNSGKLDSYIEANKPEGLLQSISNIFTGGDKTEGEKLASNSAQNDLNNVSNNSKSNIVIFDEATRTNGGTVPGEGGSVPGITFAETGMEVFSNLKIRTIR